MSARLLHAAALAAALAAAGPAAAQTTPVLTLTEITRSGASHAMGAKTRAVDVNSRLRIEIDRDALLGASGGAALPPSLADAAETLTQILRGANDDLAAMRIAEAAFTANPSSATRAALVAALQPLGARALAVIRMVPRGQLNAALVPGQLPEEQYAAVFAAAAAYADGLQSQLDSLAAREGVKVRMGAWIVTGQGSREVHLPGFDTVQTQAASIVPSFQLILTSEQAAQFQALATEARTLRAQAGASPFADATALGNQLRAVAQDGLACVRALPNQLAPLASTPTVQSLLTANAAVVTTWDSLRARYGAGLPPATQLLATGPHDAVAAWTVLRQWLSAADNLLAAAPAEADAAVTTARSALDSCRAGVQSGVARELAPLVTGLPSDAARRLATESLEFSERVLTLDLGKVPAETELSLVTAGQRSAGDQIALRMSVVEASGRERVLDSRSYLVERVEPHIQLSVAMIWARRDPPTDSAGTPRGNRWHPAPGYSILAKRFFGDGGYARRHPMYAEVLNPGIGINLSAPDFNLDDTPEFAAGGVVSVFRDYIQGGYSYNFQLSQGFWFIGIRLPLPSATLPATETSPDS